MSVDALHPANAGSDLPLRNWRCWWLAWPKWFRIGCWAFGGVLLLHVALAVRMVIGQIEAPEITQLRQRGAVFSYFWLEYSRPEPFQGYEWLMAGVFGRSTENVSSIRLIDATDADLQFLSTHFPNLKNLSLSLADVTEDGLAALAKFPKLHHLSLLVSSAIDDAEVEKLAELDSVTMLHLRESRVTDAAIPALKRMKSLIVADVWYTDVSLEAIAAWRAEQTTKKVRIDTEKEIWPAGDLLGRFRWADGTYTMDYPGPATVTIDGPLDSDSSQTRVANHLYLRCHDHLHWTAGALAWYADGDYRFTLKLGDYDSEPVLIHFENGQPSMHRFDFQMPVPKQQGLNIEPRAISP